MERKAMFRILAATVIVGLCAASYFAGFMHGHIDSHSGMTDETFTEAVQRHLRAKEAGEQDKAP